MEKPEDKKTTEEFNRISEECTRSPAPEGEGFPTWTQDGIESTSEFFNSTAHLWDARFGSKYSDLHKAVAKQIPKTNEPISILDVGCGTGLELEFIFERAPNARITGLDQAPRMLAELRKKYADRIAQITLIETSCLQWPKGLSDFDYAISILVLHHFPPETKQQIHSNIKSSLKAEGIYIEGDQMVSPKIESQSLELFNQWVAKLPDGNLGSWNYDIRLSVETNQRLHLDAGFSSSVKVWNDSDRGSDSHAVLVAQ